MLAGENFGRHHQRGLLFILHRGQHRNHRHDRLAAADVALQQTIHGRVRSQVTENLFDDFALRVS